MVSTATPATPTSASEAGERVRALVDALRGGGEHSLLELAVGLSGGELELRDQAHQVERALLAALARNLSGRFGKRDPGDKQPDCDGMANERAIPN